MPDFDLILTRGRYFDGSNAKSFVADVGIRHGRIAAVSESPLPVSSASRVIDAEHHWVCPGFIDSHTHYDAEVLISPSLSESVRHGVTTVLMGSCSLSLICSDAEDASDLFTRVETIPREKVLPILEEKKTWSSPAEWVQHISSLPLGPNVVSLLGHSDLRASAMGLLRSTRLEEKPTEEELQTMERILEEALDAGFLGLSTMRLKWDKIDGERAWSRSLPSTYARWNEISRLLKIVRKRARIHQGAPNVEAPLQVFDYLFESTGWFRKNLKTTLIAQNDLKASPYLNTLTRIASAFTNLFRGDFRWQVLPTPFAVYADGIDLVIFEEFGAGEMALNLRDKVERDELLRDEEYRRTFRKFYGEKLSPRVWQRDFGDAQIIDCPDPALIGRNFAEIADERSIHVVDLFLDMVVEYGRKLRWFTVIGNHRPPKLRQLVRQKRSLITFSDAGAHIRNMAFYNIGLRLLKMAKEGLEKDEPFMSIEEAVHKMSGDQADWFGIDAGYIRVGDRADVVVIDPRKFDQDLNAVHWDDMENFQMQRLVNRNPGLVNSVLINGKIAVENGAVSKSLGQESGFGQFLPATGASS